MLHWVPNGALPAGFDVGAQGRPKKGGGVQRRHTRRGVWGHDSTNVEAYLRTLCLHRGFRGEAQGITNAASLARESIAGFNELKFRNARGAGLEDGRLQYRCCWDCTLGNVPSTLANRLKGDFLSSPKAHIAYR